MKKVYIKPLSGTYDLRLGELLFDWHRSNYLNTVDSREQRDDRFEDYEDYDNDPNDFDNVAFWDD